MIITEKTEHFFSKNQEFLFSLTIVINSYLNSIQFLKIKIKLQEVEIQLVKVETQLSSNYNENTLETMKIIAESTMEKTGNIVLPDIYHQFRTEVQIKNENKK